MKDAQKHFGRKLSNNRYNPPTVIYVNREKTLTAIQLFFAILMDVMLVVIGSVSTHHHQMIQNTFNQWNIAVEFIKSHTHLHHSLPFPRFHIHPHPHPLLGVHPPSPPPARRFCHPPCCLNVHLLFLLLLVVGLILIFVVVVILVLLNQLHWPLIASHPSPIIHHIICNKSSEATIAMSRKIQHIGEAPH